MRREFAEFGSTFLSLFSEAVLASLLAAALLTVMPIAQFRGMNFTARFIYILWRYTVPAIAFTWVIFWLVSQRPTP
jgi:hypothetical protein